MLDRGKDTKGRMHEFHQDLQSNYTQSIQVRMALGIFWLVTEIAQLDEEPTDGTSENGLIYDIRIYTPMGTNISRPKDGR